MGRTKSVFGHVRSQPSFGMEGKVFAIRLKAGRWGFIRFWSGTGFGFLPVVAKEPGMPLVDWREDPEPWMGSTMADGEVKSLEDYRLVGVRPVVAKEIPVYWSAVGGGEPMYMIYRGHECIPTKRAADVVGLAEEKRYDAEEMRTFLQEQDRRWNLVEVEVGPVEEVKRVKPRKMPVQVVARIVEAVSPAEREARYEEALGEFLEETGLGEITGGGTMRSKGKIEYAEIVTEVRDVKRGVAGIAKKLEELGVPAGSVLEWEEEGRGKRKQIGGKERRRKKG